MKLLQVVPDTTYMVWQLYVQMLNFRDYGLEKEAIILVAISVDKTMSDEMLAFEQWTEATVLAFTDTRASKSYLSSIRPHLLAKYFTKFPNEVNVPYLYHDQDIIFRRDPGLDHLAFGDLCYVARSGHNYTGPDYMLGFKKYQFYTFCEICGITPESYIKQSENAGGAQYLLKGTTPEFWQYCEEKCEQLYRYYTDITKMGVRTWYPQEDLPDHHIQIWATDMYVMLAAMIKFNKTFRWAEQIDFCWPYHERTSDKCIMHNAGVNGSNEMTRNYKLTAADGTILLHKNPIHEVQHLQSRHKGSELELVEEKRCLFNKTTWVTQYPFGTDVSYVSDNVAQKDYTNLIERLSYLNQNKSTTMSKLKILAVFNTTNQINKDLLKLTLSCLKTAADNCTTADVKVVTMSWEPIPDNPFAENAMVTHITNLGHLNYVLQLKHILVKHGDGRDMVTIHEHDVMYPPNYFDEMVKGFDRSSTYGVWNNNYIGMNETGYQDVTQRHQPFSLLGIAINTLRDNLTRCVDEVFTTIQGNGDRGYCLLEPHNKEEFSMIPFSNVWPAIHVNMNHLGQWGTGAIGQNHHLTNHCGVCYEDNANGKVDRPEDWGNYRKYFTFDQEKKELEPEAANPFEGLHAAAAQNAS